MCVCYKWYCAMDIIGLHHFLFSMIFLRPLLCIHPDLAVYTSSLIVHNSIFMHDIRCWSFPGGAISKESIWKFRRSKRLGSNP